VGSWEDHLPRLNSRPRPIVNEYREGKVKSTPVRGVKEILKPHAYKQSEDTRGGFRAAAGLTACLLHNESASCGRQRKVKPREVKPERKRVRRGREQLPAADPKRDDLPMARVKAR
jgi:hypothetical protein